MSSLQEQLLKAGMVDKKKIKQIKQEKYQQAKQQPKGKAPVDEAKELARKAQEEKAARDREINRLKNLEAEKKAVAAQIIQLINLNRIDYPRGEVAYQFVDEQKIKKLYVTAKLQDQLVRGLVAVVRCGEQYELVPPAVAEKISQRDAAAVLVHNVKSSTEVAEDDPYADYQIPDDLMW